MKRLCLVDVSSMFFRAFFAIPPLNNKQGLPTNALYGFMSMSIKLLRDLKPDYLAYCFDRKEKSFRYNIYPEYKAHREEMPEALVPQVPYVRKLTDLLGIKAVDQVGLEADDLIGTLAKLGREHQYEVLIVSGDKDFAQLIQPHVTMYDTMKDVRYDVQGVINKWGVRPDQMIDYLALVGDSSDNIPGVRGIGPKGAQKLLAQFGTLDGIYEHVDEISAAGLKKKIIEGEADARLSQKLVTIKCDADLGLMPEDLRMKPIDRDGLHQILEELDFSTFERVLLQGGNAPSESNRKSSSDSSKKSEADTPTVVAPRNTRESHEIQECNWSLNELEAQLPAYSEVWGLDSERGVFLGVGNQVISCDGDARDLGKVLGKKQVKWFGFDLKEFWKIIHLEKVSTPAWDGMLAAYICRAGEIKGFTDVYAAYTGKQFPDLAAASAIYACHLELKSRLEEELDRVHGMKVLTEMELPLVPVLYRMERMGIRLDLAELERQSQGLARDISALEKEIHHLAGEFFNISSPKQLSHVLFEKLKLPVGRKTKTGFSTDSDVLATLESAHPIAGKIIEYRELTKLKGTYVDALPLLVDQETHRIHTNFRQAATSTGRLSSVNPNLQNIPIRTDRGRAIRKAFLPSPGKLLISADYSQIELRVLAHMSNDPGLITAFSKDLDIHAATASEIFGVSLDGVTDDLRRKAKAVNFGIAYGQGPYGLAETLGISRGEAKTIIDRYFERFAGVKKYMEETVEHAKRQGFVETLFGRRRYLDELKSKNPALRNFGERAAINAPIQGTASDLVKKAMIDLYDSISIPMLIQVHDEVLFECDPREVEEQEAEIKRIMESAVQLKVPLKVNISHGSTWDET